MTWRVVAVVVLVLVVGRPDAGANLSTNRIQGIPEEELLDVGIQVFEPVARKSRLFANRLEASDPELRQSEAAFVAAHLMRTLQATGGFGIVRVVPSSSRTVHLMVTGRLRTSTGRRLVLDLQVTDATSRRWLDKRYKGQANSLAYALGFDLGREPFQHLYNRFAADLSAVRERLGRDRIRELHRTAELRFAAQLAPGVFSDYLDVGRRGRTHLERLPSRDDPMLARIRQIRVRDEFFLDLLTQRYVDFYAAMSERYLDYRASRYEVEMALLEAREQANLYSMPQLGRDGGFIPPTRRATRRANHFRRQAAAQARFLDEISGSFSLIVEPLLLELDGEVIRFAGSLEDQYAQWQKLLEKVFASETGLPVSSLAAPDLPLGTQ